MLYRTRRRHFIPRRFEVMPPRRNSMSQVDGARRLSSYSPTLHGTNFNIPSQIRDHFDETNSDQRNEETENHFSHFGLTNSPFAPLAAKHDPADIEIEKTTYSARKMTVESGCLTIGVTRKLPATRRRHEALTAYAVSISIRCSGFHRRRFRSLLIQPVWRTFQSR